MIYTEEAKKKLMNIGLTPVVIPDSKNPKKDHIFIEQAVVWDKLFNGIKQDRPDLDEAMQSVPHINWIKRIIIAKNPELQTIEVEGQIFYGIMFKEIMEKAEKVPHLDQCLGFVFTLIQEYMVELISQFE